MPHLVGIALYNLFLIPTFYRVEHYLSSRLILASQSYIFTPYL